MSFKYGAKSERKLKQLDNRMVCICRTALAILSERQTTDATIFETLRSPRRQQYLFNTGRSKTLNSRHFAHGDTGKSHAVDIVAWQGRPSWDAELMYEVCRAMVLAAQASGYRVKWGGVWKLCDELDAEDLRGEVRKYIAERKAIKRKPFVDMAHFQLEQ